MTAHSENGRKAWSELEVHFILCDMIYSCSKREQKEVEAKSHNPLKWIGDYQALRVGTYMPKSYCQVGAMW